MRRTRVAVIGTGRIAEEHLTALSRREDVELVGVCDLDPYLARRAARLYRATAYTDAATMLDDVHPQAVHVTTPPHSHVPLARQAVDAGCELVVLEKPAALSAPELTGLLDAARAAGAAVVEDHNYRFNAPVQRLGALVAGGALGDVRSVDVRMAIPLGSTRYEQDVDRRAAERMPAGVLHEFLPHLCYLAGWLLPAFGDVRAEWGKRDAGTVVTPDHLAVSATGAAGARATLLFESGVAPATTTVTVRGTEGWAEADLQLASLRTSLPRGFGDQLDPIVDLARGGLALLASSRTSFLAKLRGSPIYEGIGVFVDRVHDAHRRGGPMPVTGAEMTAAAALADAIVEQRP